MRGAVRAAGVGVQVAVITYALGPSPSWWLGGLISFVILRFNPCPPCEP